VEMLGFMTWPEGGAVELLITRSEMQRRRCDSSGMSKARVAVRLRQDPFSGYERFYDIFDDNAGGKGVWFIDFYC